MSRDRSFWSTFDECAETLTPPQIAAKKRETENEKKALTFSLFPHCSILGCVKLNLLPLTSALNYFAFAPDANGENGGDAKNMRPWGIFLRRRKKNKDNIWLSLEITQHFILSLWLSYERYKDRRSRWGERRVGCFKVTPLNGYTFHQLCRKSQKIGRTPFRGTVLTYVVLLHKERVLCMRSLVQNWAEHVRKKWGNWGKGGENPERERETSILEDEDDAAKRAENLG